MKKNLLLAAIATLGLIAATKAQNITNLSSIWYNTFSANSGGFGRAIIDNNDLVISGASWPSWPSGTTDQMVTKINPSGNIIFQTVRAPGSDHDGYQAVVKLQNGNYGFFGQQNAQGTQYFDGFYTEFNSLGSEVLYNFFSVPGSSSGSDMLMLPNGNRLYTGNHGGGQNYIALTDANFNQINYQTFFVGGWNYAQLGIDSINNFVYAIGSESSTSTIQIVKYDMSLNFIATFNITHTEPLLNYDIKIDGNDILLCGYRVLGGQRFGSFYRMNANGVITDSFVAQNNSEFTAIEKYGNEIILSKSNLLGTNSLSNELIIYQGSGSFGVTHSLNSSSPFVPFDLVLNGDTLYAVGAQGSGYWIGIPAVEKILIEACSPSYTSESISACSNYTWSANGQSYSQSGQYTTVLTNSAGCDSTVTLGLTITQPTAGSETVIECDSYTWSTNGQTYNQSGQYTEVLTNQSGCDSTVILNLTITNSNISIESVTECDSYTWITNGQTYTQSGQYTSVLTNENGCDSTVTLNLTINQPSASTQTETALDSYTWPVNGQTYTQSGTYTAVIPNSAGCDSIITLDLTLSFTGIDEQDNSTILISPNPSSDYFMVSASEELIGEAYSIIDLNGKTLTKGTLTQKEQKIEIGNLSEGMYLFKIKNKTEHTFRILKN
jgi:hypothetical protein